MALFRKNQWTSGGQGDDLGRLLADETAVNVQFTRARDALIAAIELGVQVFSSQPDFDPAPFSEAARTLSQLHDQLPFETTLPLGDGTAMHFWLLPTDAARSRGAVVEWLNMRTGKVTVKRI